MPEAISATERAFGLARRRAGWVTGWVILTAVLCAALFVVFHASCPSRFWQTRSDLAVLEMAITVWSADHPDGCPQFEDLPLARGVARVDGWGTPFVLACGADHVSVHSLGADRRLGTQDDLREVVRW